MAGTPPNRVSGQHRIAALDGSILLPELRVVAIGGGTGLSTLLRGFIARQNGRAHPSPSSSTSERYPLSARAISRCAPTRAASFAAR